MSKTCQCPNPPGGQVTCEDGQLAVCSVDRNGEVDAACYTPQSGATRVQLQNWALAIVTGERRAPAKPLSPEDHAVIERAFYRRTDGTLVHFRMPNLTSEGSPFRTA